MHQRVPVVWSDLHLFSWGFLTKVIVCLEYGTYTYVNVNTKWKSREHRCRLIHQDMSFPGTDYNGYYAR